MNDRTRILGDRAAGRGPASAREALAAIYQALGEKGYDPVRQIAHFLLTGEPTYITAHKDARSLAQRLERDEIIEELLRAYLADLRHKPTA
ncbi:MAG TPA: IreB family regulatory phosphoprotein [Bacillota bacterium]